MKSQQLKFQTIFLQTKFDKIELQESDNMNNYETTTTIMTTNGCEIEIMRPILSDTERQRRIEHLKTTAAEVLKRAGNRNKTNT